MSECDHGLIVLGFLTLIDQRIDYWRENLSDVESDVECCGYVLNELIDLRELVIKAAE